MPSKSFDNLLKLNAVSVTNNVNTFTTSISAPALSGAHFGDGSRLTGVIASGGSSTDSTKLPLAGGTLNGPLIGTTATFNTSISAPALSGAFFGDGSRLAGIASSSHTHTKSQITDFAHTHAISDVTNLQTNLDAKLNLTGGTVTGNLIVQNNLTVQGNLTALGTTTFVNNTTFTTTSAFSITNVSPVSGSSALYVGQSGPADIASFYDIDRNIEVLHVGGANSIFPGVGVRTSNPNKTFSVAGEISASQDVWTGGSFRGDGSKLTGVSSSDKLPLSGGTLIGALSAPALSGTFYGDGSNLTGITTSSIPANTYGTPHKSIVIGTCYTHNNTLLGSNGLFDKSQWETIPPFTTTLAPVLDIKSKRGYIHFSRSTENYFHSSLSKDGKKLGNVIFSSDLNRHAYLKSANVFLTTSTTTRTVSSGTVTLPAVRRYEGGVAGDTGSWGLLSSTNYTPAVESYSFVKYFDDLHDQGANPFNGHTSTGSFRVIASITVPEIVGYTTRANTQIPEAFYATGIFENQWHIFRSTDGISWSRTPVNFVATRISEDGNPAIIPLSGTGQSSTPSFEANGAMYYLFNGISDITITHIVLDSTLSCKMIGTLTFPDSYTSYGETTTEKYFFRSDSMFLADLVASSPTQPITLNFAQNYSQPEQPPITGNPYSGQIAVNVTSIYPLGYRGDEATMDEVLVGYEFGGTLPGYSANTLTVNNVNNYYYPFVTITPVTNIYQYGQIYGINYSEHEGLYVATGHENMVYVSKTGASDSWRTIGTLLSGETILDMTRTSTGVYVVMTNTGKLLHSYDKVTWTQSTSGTANGLRYNSNNNTILAFNSNEIFRSTNGINWTRITANIPTSINTIAEVSGGYIACGSAGQISISNDGATWTTATSPITGTVYSAAYGGVSGRYVVCGENSGARILAYTSALMPSPTTTTFAQATAVTSYVNSVPTSLIATQAGFVAYLPQYSNTLDGRYNPSFTSSDGITWNERGFPNSPPSSTSSINDAISIAYGNGIYLLSVAERTWTSNQYRFLSYMNYSVDGKTWYPTTTQPIFTGFPTNSAYKPLRLEFANGLFIAQNRAGAISTSSDTATWTTRMSSVLSATTLYGDWGVGLVKGSTGVLSIAENRYSFSSNSINWSTYNGPLSSTINCTYDAVANKYVVWNNIQLCTSTDGITWTTPVNHGVNFGTFNSNAYSHASIDTVAANNNIIVVAGANLGSGRPVRYSPDGGTTFLNVSSVKVGSTWFTSSQAASVKYIGDRFVFMGPEDGSKFLYSFNGVHWFVYDHAVTLSDIAYGNGIFVATTGSKTTTTSFDEYLYSVDGHGWLKIDFPGAYTAMSVAYGNGKFVVINDTANLAFYSTNGINWNSSPATITGNLSRVRYLNNKFIISSSTNSLSSQHSSDGITWSTMVAPPSTAFYAEAYINGKYIAYPVSKEINDIYTSSDASTWTTVLSALPKRKSTAMLGHRSSNIAVNTSGTVAIAALAFDNVGEIARSVNGTVWTSVQTPLQDYVVRVVYGNGVFVAFDNGGASIYSIDDGLTWRLSYPGPAVNRYPTYYSGIAGFFAGKFICPDARPSSRFLANNGAPYSTDGISWIYPECFNSASDDDNIHRLHYVNNRLFFTNKHLSESTTKGHSWLMYTSADYNTYAYTNMVGKGNIFVTSTGRCSRDRGVSWTQGSQFDTPWIRMEGDYIVGTNVGSFHDHNNPFNDRTRGIAVQNINAIPAGNSLNWSPIALPYEVEPPLFKSGNDEYFSASYGGYFYSFTADTSSFASIYSPTVNIEEFGWRPRVEGVKGGAIAFIETPFIDVGVSTAGTTISAVPAAKSISYYDLRDTPKEFTTNFDQNVTMLGNLDLTTITEKSMRLYPNPATSSLTIDLTKASFFLLPLTMSLTSVSFTTPAVDTRVYSFSLQLSADGTVRSIAWPSAVKWPNNVAPTITSTSGKTDTLGFLTHDKGATWFGYVVAQNH